MEKEFVPYEQTLALKKLGFNEPCMGYYDKANVFFFFPTPDRDNTNSVFDFFPTAPLFQQAFDWFREKYKIHSFIDIYPTTEEPNRCWYMLRYLEREIENKEDYMSGWFDNQEAARLGSLKKLIEIVTLKK